MALRTRAHAPPAAMTLTDRIFLAYVAATGALIAAFGWRLSVRLWIGLSLSHVVLLLLGTGLAHRAPHGRSPPGFVRDTYPLFFVPFLYWEIRYTAKLVSSGYHDALIQRLELAVFGRQLAITFSRWLPYPWLSEMMHFFYATYWIMLPVAFVALYLRGRLDGFRELVFVELALFLSCYLIYIFFPVAGPFYHFRPIGGRLADGFFYRLVHGVLADGGSRGAAFPSSHVAVALGISLVTWRYDRVVWAALTPLVVGLIFGTVYGRFHYGIDALSGVVFALAVVPVARWIWHRRRGPLGPGGVGNLANRSPV